MAGDPSNGWNDVARDFIALRSPVGLAIVHAWAASLPAGASVVDVGAGHGEPLTAALVGHGLDVRAIDAAPAMAAALRRRFPDMPVACEAAEASAFFGRRFDAVMAVGLVFLLDEAGQRALLARMAGALRPGGHLLFTAPAGPCTWPDALTGRASRSLGAEAYARILGRHGLVVTHRSMDEGGNTYHHARKSGDAAEDRRRPVRPA